MRGAWDVTGGRRGMVAGGQMVVGSGGLCCAPACSINTITLLLPFMFFTKSTASSVTAGMVIVGGGALGVELAISFSSSVMSALKSPKSGVERYL